MSEAKKSKIKSDMAVMSGQFSRFYSEYYKGSYDDTRLLEFTTQPYWQSMRLSKRRLESKGLTLDMDMDAVATSEPFFDGRIFIEKDGLDFVGTSTRKVITNRSFRQDKKRIYSQKEQEISTISMLQAEVEGELAACPNCGHVGKVESYIDGCDACGAKFTVKDFATKVSGFSLEENVWDKLKKTVMKTLLTLGFITAALIVLGVISLLIVAFRLVGGQNDIGIIAPLIGFMMSLDLVPVGFKCIILLPVAYAILMPILSLTYKKRYTGEKIVSEVIPDFSAEDFCQNLEYKLRNIHLTDTAGEVGVFARCSLNSIVQKYMDVIDCNASWFRFKAARKEAGGYIVDVEVVMKLTLFNGKRIRTKYEKIALSLYGKEALLKRRTVALREYKCENCNGSINILEGSRCKHCDSVFDYADYGWIIESYKVEDKPANIYQVIRAAIVAVYILIFASHILFIEGDTENDTWISLTQEFAAAADEVKELYDAVVMPDDISDEAVLVSSKDNILSRKNVYSVENGAAVTAQYLPYILEQEFILYAEKSTENSFVFYRVEVVQDDPGYIRVTVTYTEKEIVVLIEAVETPDEDTGNYSVS